MTKPHEETWERKGDSVVSKQRGRVLYVVRLYPSDTASLDLAAAAPELARVLLCLLTHHSIVTTRAEAEAIDAAHAALAKAGVPLP